MLALTTFDLDEYVFAAVRAGPAASCSRTSRLPTWCMPCTSSRAAMHCWRPALTRRLLDRFAAAPVPGALPVSLANLPGRELEVLREVARGSSNAETAAELYLSEATVKTYVSRLLTRLDLRDRVQLAVLAYETGLVEPGSDAR